MPLLKKSFQERNPVTLGAVALVAFLVLVGAGLNAGPLLLSLTGSSYTAELTDAGGIKPMDFVKLNGVKVGAVDAVELDGEHVAVRFSMQKVGRLGTATRVSIKTSTVLGSKYLAVEPHGPGQLESGAVIPVERTDPGYDLTNALSSLSRTSEQLDKRQLTKALDAVSDTLANTPAPLRATLTGLNRLSRTLASRDAALRELLEHANSVTGVLAHRGSDLVTLVSDGNQLVAALNARRAVIQELLINVTATITQLDGLVRDNQRQLGPALDGLRDVLELLKRNDKNVAAAVHGLNTYAGSLGEAVGGGPWFFASVQNLPPTNFVPPLPLGANPVAPARGGSR
ncbi:MAG TPA: MCE family protein [Pseudonocardia sp.]|jgi:phospholipid/cholesterol/gamma-HCH transport system substrate-binding protein|nr:MCE family protein [Pseudonocardia sp.]